MRYGRFFIIAGLLLAPCLLLGQSQAQQNLAAGQDWLRQVYDQCNALLDNNADVLLKFSMWELAFIIVFKVGSTWARIQWPQLGMIGGHSHRSGWPDVITVLFYGAVLSIVVRHWNVPLFGTLSIHQWPTAIGKTIVKAFDDQTVSEAMTYINGTVVTTEKPHYWNLVEVGIYFGVQAMMALVQFTMFFVNSLGAVGYAVWAILGQALIPLAMTNWFRSWFWNLVGVMASLAAYRPITAGFIYVFSHLYLNFYENSIAGDYSLANWFANYTWLVALTFTFLFASFTIPLLSAMVFGHAGSYGQQLTTTASNSIRGVLS